MRFYWTLSPLFLFLVFGIGPQIEASQQRLDDCFQAVDDCVDGITCTVPPDQALEALELGYDQCCNIVCGCSCSIFDTCIPCGDGPLAADDCLYEGSLDECYACVDQEFDGWGADQDMMMTKWLWQQQCCNSFCPTGTCTIFGDCIWSGPLASIVDAEWRNAKIPPHMGAIAGVVKFEADDKGIYFPATVTPLDSWQCDRDDDEGCQDLVDDLCETNNQGTGTGDAEITAREDGSLLCMGTCDSGAKAFKDCPAGLSDDPDVTGIGGGNADVEAK